MCAEAKVNDEWCDTQGSLKAALGISCVVLEDGYSDDSANDEHCLCPVNIPKTAALAGYSAAYNESYDWIFTKGHK